MNGIITQIAETCHKNEVSWGSTQSVCAALASTDAKQTTTNMSIYL